MPDVLFPREIDEMKWERFRVRGYRNEVSGVIHRATTSPALCGMPLGCIDTGCIDLETSGMWGYSTIFNSHVPRGGPLNLPFLGISVEGDTWILSTLQPKELSAEKSVVSGDADDDDQDKPKIQIDGVRSASEVYYFGHYPIADMQYDIDAPVSVGVRAYTPFIPGDVDSSMVPGAVFQVYLQNTSKDRKKGTIAFTFGGPSDSESLGKPAARREVKGKTTGLCVETGAADYFLGAIDEHTVRIGGDLGIDGSAWSKIQSSLPDISTGNRGSSAAVDFVLAPLEERVIKFVLTWYSPVWRGSGDPSDNSSNTFTHMYTTRYQSAEHAAEYLAENHEALLKRIVSWQQVIYDNERLPIWLQESLVNILHLIAEDGMWAKAEPPVDDWCRPDDGIFGLNESPRGCPQIECIPCSWYGNFPLVFFFPKLALSTLRAYKAYQDEEGCPPWIFGGHTKGTGPCEMTMPTRGYQVTENGASYTDMVNRYWLRTGDRDFLREFYPSVKKAMIFTMSLNQGEDGVISMPDHRVSEIGPPWETEAFEHCEWYGMAARIGGRHLAQLETVKKMADELGDFEFAERCQEWIDQGRRSMEDKMWTGSYYLNFYEPSSGRKMDVVFGYQLDGQWVAALNGLPDVFDSDRIRETLKTIKNSNIQLTRYGAVNFANADGTLVSPDQEFLHLGYQPYDFYPPEVMILGMTYMYEGEVEFGTELIRRCVENIVLEQRRSWDAPNIINGITGKAKFGNDYYQNMILWVVPIAIEVKSLSEASSPDSFISEIIRAGSIE